MESAKAELLRPFPQEEELAKKQARLHEVNALLDMDEKGKAADPTKETAVAAEKTNSGKVIAVSIPTMQPQAAYGDQPKRPSVLKRLKEKQAAVANRQNQMSASAHKKEQTL